MKTDIQTKLISSTGYILSYERNILNMKYFFSIFFILSYHISGDTHDSRVAVVVPAAVVVVPSPVVGSQVCRAVP